MAHGPQIALTPQTDERNFPRWENNAPPGKSGHPYPKMLTKVCTKEDREAWLKRNVKIDRNTREEYWDERAPRVGSPMALTATDEIVDAGFAKVAGEPLVANSAADEAIMLDMLGIRNTPEPAGKVSIPLAAVSDDDDDDDLELNEADEIEKENRRLEAALKRNAELKRQLAASSAPEKTPAKKTVKRKKAKRKAAPVRAVSLEEMAEGGDED